MDQSANRRHSGDPPPTEVGTRSLPRHRRQAVVALVVCAITIFACALVAYLAYDFNREMIFRHVAKENLTIARNVADYINEPIPIGDEEAMVRTFEQIRARWVRFDPPTSEAFLCVVNPEGKLVVCTAHTNMEGEMVNDLPLGKSSTPGATTIGDLLSTKEDFFGEDSTLMGERQLVGFTFSKMLNLGVMVHIPTAQIESDVATASWPWSLGIGVVAGLLILLSLGLLHRCYSSAQSAALRSESAIQEKEKQLDNLLSNVGVIVLEGDPFNFYYVGGQVERILGYRKELWFEDPDGPIGFWAKHLHPDDSDKIEACHHAIELGLDHAFEYRMIAADGREIWFYDTVTVETENGVPVKTRSVMVDITGRKQAEIELGENEGRIRALLEGAFEGILITEKGKILEANHAFAGMYGYELEEVIGLSPVELTTPESAQEIAQRIASENEEPYEIVGLKKDGTTFDLEILGKNCIYRGRVARISAVRDITDKKKLEKASLARIQRAERQQATITELVTHPTLKGGDLKEAAKVITQLAGTAIEVERTSIWLLNHDRKSIRCENLFELTPNRHSHGLLLREDDFPSYFQALMTSRAIVASDAVADSRTCEFKDSYLNPLGITSLLDVAVRVSGEIVGVVCHEHVRELRDWTPDEIAFAGQVADQVALVLSNQERQRARRALRESEEQVRLLLDSTGEAIYGLDLDGNCTFCNPACLELLGYDSPGSLMGKNMHELIHHTRKNGAHYPVAECRNYKAIREGRGIHVDDEVLWKQNGESFDAEYWSFPIRREGQIVGSVVTFLDITERKLTQDRQKLLMAELDHRVKNNLSAVIALAEQTIVTAPSLAAFRESYVGRIRALARIHETLAATKWTGAKLNEILRLTLDPYSREDSHRISTRGEDIILDARSCQPITMALHELATNAAKYGSLSTPEGTIRIEWRLDPKQQLHLSWIESGGPPITDPPQPGFGSSLIRGVIEHELAGTVEIEYLKEGLSCTMVIPMEQHPPHGKLLEAKISPYVKEQVLP